VSNRRRGPISGETNPIRSRTPGPTGIRDAADESHRVTIPRGRGPLGVGKGGHKEAAPAAPTVAGCRPAAAGPIHIPLSVYGTPRSPGTPATTVNVYIFVDHPGSATKAHQIAGFLERIPFQHVQQVFQNTTGGYVIFIIKDKPGRGGGGGTWTPSEVDRAFRGRHRVTCVPDAELQALVLTPGYGVIGIPMNRWGTREFSRGRNPLEFTLVHEVGHAVDYSYARGVGGTGLSPPSPPGTNVSDWCGVRPACGGVGLGRYVAEAYARFILVPRRICNDTDPGHSQSACLIPRTEVPSCTSRIIDFLRRSPAFSSVSGTWMPPT